MRIPTRIISPALAALLWAAPLAADTIWLNTGIKFDGVVNQRPDGSYQVRAGDRLLVFRADEVAKIEENDRTGALDLDEVRARWAARDAELTAETGLNAEQRRLVEAALWDLQNEEDGIRLRARNDLIRMQEQFDVFKYLAFQFPQLSHRLSPHALETLVLLDAGRGRAVAREALTHPYQGTRAKAIEMLGRVNDTEYAAEIARGLVDHSLDVRIAAAFVLGALGAKAATPVLIGSLTHPDLRVNNAARDALNTIWRAETGGERLVTPEEWQKLWGAQAARVGTRLAAVDLKPLIDPELEFQDE